MWKIYKVSAVFVTAAFLGSAPVSAMINITYNNVTGDYTVGGSDNGPGDGITTRVDYRWVFDNPFPSETTLFVSLGLLSLGLTADGAFAGTAGTGSPAIVSFVPDMGFGGDPLTVDFRAIVSSDPGSGGPLIFDGSSGTVASGLWTAGLGDFVGQPTTVANPTTSPLTFTIVPEPSSFGVLVGLLAVGLTLTRRRRLMR
ncbi:MAG: PEP-CTERM sorting domain-containing protein [Verrucomicrobiota bacterium]